MHKALLEEKHEFVRLFIDHAVVDFKHYLDDTELQERDGWIINLLMSTWKPIIPGLLFNVCLLREPRL